MRVVLFCLPCHFFSFRDFFFFTQNKGGGWPPGFPLDLYCLRLNVDGTLEYFKHKTTITISFPELRSPCPAVGKRELWEHPFQACAIDTIDADCSLRSKTGYAEFGYFHCYLKMDAPRALVFRPLVKGNEALGTRLRQ